MTAKQQWMVVAGIVALLATGGYVASRLLSDELTQVTIGSKAPDFQAVTLDSIPVLRSMQMYRGEVVLLNIWATWCGPCRVEMPSIEALHRELGPRGLKVVAVSIDVPGKEQEIRDFMAEFGLTFEIVFDSTGMIKSQYRTTGVPETFIIARDGTIRKKIIGPEDWNSPANRKLVEMLLAEKE